MLGMSPVAAKATLESTIAEQTGVSVTGLSDASLDIITRGGPDYEQRVTQAGNYIRMFGLPHAIEEEYRNEARNVRWLDIDIACKRSWSMSVKVMTQRERNYQRMVEGIRQNVRVAQARKLLKTVSGFDWPW